VLCDCKVDKVTFILIQGVSHLSFNGQMTLNENLVFVVGVYRSGTSLLCSLLNQNPNLALMFEFDVWNFPSQLLRYRFDRNWLERMEFSNRSLSRHRLISANDRQRLEKIRTPLDVYHAFAEMKGAAVGGEKSPFYCDRLEQLQRLYPTASFIIVWRNPAEVYRSILKAGKTSRFFGRPGMLNRMIYYQEQVIRQADRIEMKGTRVYRVDYAKIVDETERTCRDISAFLDVPFDPRMLGLNQADLSTAYKAPHHVHLHRGVVERQKYPEELVSAAVAKKLERYRHRWERQQAKCPTPAPGPPEPEPGSIELVYHRSMGNALILYDSLKRGAFEFLPLPWLRVYRLLKNWVINPPSGSMDEKTSLVKDWAVHWPTITTAALLVGVVTTIHACTNPHLALLLFYAIPCVLLALVVSMRWATLFALACSLIILIVQYAGESNHPSPVVVAWNLFNRFVLLEIIVLTVGRIRMELSPTKIQES
jgi:hypothetical protein